MLLATDRLQVPIARPPLAGTAPAPDPWQDPWQDPKGKPGRLPSAAQVAALLDENETIEWAGRPAPGGLVRWSLACWAVFFPWTLFCLHWINGLGMGDPGGLDDPFRWFCIAGFPFLALGIGGLATPVWIGHRARRTLHVMTDRRELTFECGVLARSVRHRDAERGRDPYYESSNDTLTHLPPDKAGNRGFGVPSAREQRSCNPSPACAGPDTVVMPSPTARATVRSEAADRVAAAGADRARADRRTRSGVSSVALESAESD